MNQTRSFRPGWLIGAAVFVVISMAFGPSLQLAVDYLWFKELNLLPIFKTSLFTKINLSGAVCALAFLLIYANIFIANMVGRRSSYFPSFADSPLVRLFNTAPIARALLIVGALVISLLVGTGASALWDQYLRFRFAAPFGINDPLFGKDISFYVFRLPFLTSAYSLFVLILVLSIGCSLASYLLQRNIGFDGRSIRIAPGPRAHLIVLLGIFCLSLFIFFQLRMYAMVTVAGGIANGAGYSQVKIEIPLLGIMRYVSIGAAVLIWLSAARRTLGLLAAAIALLVVGGLITGTSTYVVQKFVVGPNELTKETPYIAWTINNTRLAYGLDKIESRRFVPTANLDAGSLATNEPTIGNIRLWEHAPLLTTYSQLQEIRTYYQFLDVDNDRYLIDGKLRQVMLSPRELVPASLPSRSWINERLTYTHGYGICMGPVNSITPEGLPDFFVKNIPPASSAGPSVTHPEIYYGESDAGYAIVKTGAKEFDYPSGSDNIYTTYHGTGGIRVGGIMKKLLFAVYFGEMKILLRGDITADSRVLFNRRILQRIGKAAPFLKYDGDPFMVITKEGRLVWMLDGYTVTDAYPYSAQVQGIGNYMRNSVKAVIDAYDGSLSLYIWDDTDPIITTYARIFPGVFKPMTQMPQDLQAHVRYPQTMFTVQAQVYATYHMTDPQVFYNKEDVWRIPASTVRESDEPMSPYYTIMKLAEVGTKEEFILMVPFCPSKKENMIAWLAARCDQPDYGKLLVFDFPKQKLVYGPSQIESRINQDAEISKQLTLWNQGGSRVIRGSLLVIPVEQSLIYVQPLYIASENGGVPELKRVIAAYENNIAMEETLEKSLLRIFGAAPQEPVAEAPAATPSTAPQAPIGDLRGLIDEADKQFRAGQEELRKGNWAGYGAAMERVRGAIEELAKKAR